MILKSINYWSYPGGLDGSLALPDFFAKAKAHGFEAVEVAIGHEGHLNVDATEADCKTILEQAAAAGVKVASVASGTYWARAVADADPELRALAIEDLKKMLQITAWLGCTTLLTIPGAVDVFFLPDRPAQPYAQVKDLAFKGMKECLPTAEAVGVRMGIENVWNKFLLSPTEMCDFIDSFESDFVGSYFDVGNVMPWGHPQDWLRTLGHRVVGIHFKDFKCSIGTIDGFVDLLQGDVNWPEVMKAIEEIGYDGPIPTEMIPGYTHHPEARCANTSTSMDYILGRRS
jgi:hexulose-6-phosphate isomerase